MKIRVLGAGFYGCHIALALIRDGHEVEIHEICDRIFAGASGSIPARLHEGFHYPRARMTRAACQEHREAFMAHYGNLTRGVPINIYAIAQDQSLVDYAQYIRTLAGEVQFVQISAPEEFGLANVEGAVLTGERHIVTDLARTYFETSLEGHVIYGMAIDDIEDRRWDCTIDCTFGARSDAGVDRYEPCLVLRLHGPTDRAITIMDGPFPSLYPWNEEKGISSLSSARWTPFSKSCRSWAEANALIQDLSGQDIIEQSEAMMSQMAEYYPRFRDLYKLDRPMISIRAMPLSGADQRLVDVARVSDRVLRVRAGKIDAVIHAERAIRAMIA